MAKAKIGPAQKDFIKQLHKYPIDGGDLRAMFRLSLLSKPKKKTDWLIEFLYYGAALMVAYIMLAMIDGFVL